MNENVKKQELMGKECMYATLKDMFVEEVKDCWGEKYVEAFDDEIDEYAKAVAGDLVNDMETYARKADTSIWGNFKDIRRDWNSEHDTSWDDVIAKVDNGLLSVNEHEDLQEWVEGWFFETYGTYNLKYHFANYISEELHNAHDFGVSPEMKDYVRENSGLTDEEIAEGHENYKENHSTSYAVRSKIYDALQEYCKENDLDYQFLECDADDLFEEIF